MRLDHVELHLDERLVAVLRTQLDVFGAAELAAVRVPLEADLPPHVLVATEIGLYVARLGFVDGAYTCAGTMIPWREVHRTIEIRTTWTLHAAGVPQVLLHVPGADVTIREDRVPKRAVREFLSTVQEHMRAAAVASEPGRERG